VEAIARITACWITEGMLRRPAIGPDPLISHVRILDIGIAANAFFSIASIESERGHGLDLLIPP